MTTIKTLVMILALVLGGLAYAAGDNGASAADCSMGKASAACCAMGTGPCKEDMKCCEGDVKCCKDEKGCCADRKCSAKADSKTAGSCCGSSCAKPAAGKS
jgi:hypothetical protein